MAEPVFDISAEVPVAAKPATVYALASDITQMGEWSPECVGGEWMSGEPATVGATFRGHNRAAPPGSQEEATWSTECEVLVAEPNRTFSWGVRNEIAPDNVQWSFHIEPNDTGCTLRQHFRMREATEALSRRTAGMDEEQRQNLIAERTTNLRDAMRTTINNIKQAAETA